MMDREIDRILKQAAASARDEVDAMLLERISSSLGSDLRPVRPLPSPRLLIAALVLLCAGPAGIAAVVLGLGGLLKMTLLENLVILGALAGLLGLAARLCVAESVPGSSRPSPAWGMAAVACLSLTAIFALLFRDYGMEDFVSQGIRCLRAAVGLAGAASLGIWWVLRRGFVIDRVGAGLACGTLSGLAGVLLLELHCPNLEAPHLMVWHVGAIVVTCGAGCLVGSIWPRR
jgi:hypothetical protein